MFEYISYITTDTLRIVRMIEKVRQFCRIVPYPRHTLTYYLYYCSVVSPLRVRHFFPPPDTFSEGNFLSLSLNINQLYIQAWNVLSVRQRCWKSPPVFLASTLVEKDQRLPPPRSLWSIIPRHVHGILHLTFQQLLRCLTTRLTLTVQTVTVPY
jgi:hypothetical protein